MDSKREIKKEGSQQPQISHTMPNTPGGPVRITVGSGVSEETFAQYLVDNGLATYVEEGVTPGGTFKIERIDKGISEHEKVKSISERLRARVSRIDFTKHSSLVWKVVVTALLLLIVGYGVSQAEFFQRVIYPESYWTKQVLHFEKAIKLDEEAIYSISIDLRKKRMTMQLDMAQEFSAAIGLGMSNEKAGQFAQANIERGFKSLLHELELGENKLSLHKGQLDNAKRELAGLQ